ARWRCRWNPLGRFDSGGSAEAVEQADDLGALRAACRAGPATDIGGEAVVTVQTLQRLGAARAALEGLFQGPRLVVGELAPRPGVPPTAPLAPPRGRGAGPARAVARWRDRGRASCRPWGPHPRQRAPSAGRRAGTFRSDYEAAAPDLSEKSRSVQQ